MALAGSVHCATVIVIAVVVVATVVAVVIVLVIVHLLRGLGPLLRAARGPAARSMHGSISWYY
jgi:hypothetical protein